MKNILFISSLFLVFILKGQNKTTNYINKYKSLAISEMNEFGIPASITLAQGILESGNGESRLAIEANNHFGIKCHTNWDGETIFADDDEKNECFRKYSTVEESFRDHSLFLSKRDRYQFLFNYKKTNYRKWARGLKEAGYATNPKYASSLIKIIKNNNLSKYDISTADEKKIFFSNIYGFPYLIGFGLNYFDQEQLFDISLQNSFIYLNKFSSSYNRNLFDKFYFGGGIGAVNLLYIDINYNLFFQLSHINKLSEKKRNVYQKVTLGLDFIIDENFNYKRMTFLPYLSVTNLF
mgnify:FL=1